MNSFIRPKKEAELRLAENDAAGEERIRRSVYERVCRMLWEAQGRKCYLCDRRLETDINVEHFRPVAVMGGRSNRWDNLMLSCQYCNSAKGKRDWGMPDPARCDISRRLIQFYNPVTHKVEIHKIFRGDREAENARKLLMKIYNGKHGGGDSLRSENLRRHLRAVMERFEAFLRQISSSRPVDKSVAVGRPVDKGVADGRPLDKDAAVGRRAAVEAAIGRRLSFTAEFVPFLYTRFRIWEKWYMKLGQKYVRNGFQTAWMVVRGYRSLRSESSKAVRETKSPLHKICQRQGGEF